MRKSGLQDEFVHTMRHFGRVEHRASTKLVSNLRDKTHYVTHYRCLQFYLSHGMQLVAVHRVVAFTQRAFMLPFINSATTAKERAVGFRVITVQADSQRVLREDGGKHPQARKRTIDK